MAFDLELLERLQADYPGALETRYALPATAGQASEAVLEAIGRARGAVVRGGRIDPQKAAELLLHDFRTGSLGRVTLETPELVAAWTKAAAEVEAARPARKKR